MLTTRAPAGITTNNTSILIAESIDNVVYEYTLAGAFVGTAFSLDAANTDSSCISSEA